MRFLICIILIYCCCLVNAQSNSTTAYAGSPELFEGAAAGAEIGGEAMKVDFGIDYVFRGLGDTPWYAFVLLSLLAAWFCYLLQSIFGRQLIH